MRELTDGSTAIVRGALAAGCNFFAGYPITPASAVLMMMLRELPKVGGVAIQAEDEIAAMGMCIGATTAGARAMIATSGPGLSLCSENIGLAIMGEVPLVIVVVQRMGPSTGGATTVGQGDVQFVRWGMPGGYPVIALAPSSIPGSQELTMRAFDLAERFRCPVFLLTDKELGLTTGTVDSSDWREVPVRERAPMAHFGGDELVRFTGSTHDERGFITNVPARVDRLNRHLVDKIESCRDELELVDVDIDPGAATLLIGYGVTAGSVREAVTAVRDGGGRISAMIVHGLWPVPERAIREAARDAERVVVAELNHGLYRREIERVLGGIEVVGVNRIDGRLIAPAEVMEAVR